MKEAADNLAEKAAAFRRYAPAVVPVVAFIGGVLIDRHGRFPFTHWLLAGAIVGVAWIVCFALGRYRASAVCLLGLLACLGGTRHHQAHDVARSIDISRYARTEAVPIRLRGTVTSSPIVVRAKQGPLQAAWQQRDRVLVYVRTQSVDTNHDTRPVSGIIRLQVDGDKLPVQPGDVVEIDGWIARPTGPRNPGEHDFRERLLRRRARCLVFCEDARAVRQSGETHWTPRRTLAGFRRKADALLANHLQGRPHAVGAAMLLGDRTRMNGEVRDAFIESGMMHVLAISGLHVGMLALLLVLISRLIGLRGAGMAVAVLLGVLFYALLTDVRPSIVRATIVIAILMLGRAFHRGAPMLNSLAIAALLILVWSPLDLFDLGAQLSFLSVLGMIVAAGIFQRRETDESRLRDLEERGAFSRGLRRAGGWVLRVYVMLGGIWLFTVPLVAAKLHIVSPIGLLLNLFLMPIITAVLWLGYVLVFAGMASPAVAGGVASLFSGAMEWVLWLVDRGANLKYGHRFVAGPSDWWLWVYFVWLFGILFVPKFAARRRLSIGGVLFLLAIAIGGGLVPVQREGIRCTYLSTGHGVAILIELPDGRTVLYDAGSLGDSDRASRAVQTSLWHYGHNRLDAVIVSHADIDHFNGVPKLLETVPVGKVCIAKQFLDFEQPSVKVLLDAAKKADVPIEHVRAGDRLNVGRDISLRVLHPDAADYRSDNAASIVIELTYAGRRILLTGDLERGGLDRLLRVYDRPVDVLLSPHHGSLAANPPLLGERYQPAYVIACAGRRIKMKELRKRYAKTTRVHSTFHSGAVTVVVSPDGELQVATMFDADE